MKEIENIFFHCNKIDVVIEQNLKNIELLEQSILKKVFSGKFLNKEELEECRKSSDWKSAKELLSEIQKEKIIYENKPNNLKSKRKRKAI